MIGQRVPGAPLLVLQQNPIAHSLSSTAAAGSLAGVVVAAAIGLAAWAVNRGRLARRCAAVTLRARQR